MNFRFLSINPVKLLCLIATSSVSALVLLLGLSALDDYNSVLCAGTATILFFGGGWVFFQMLEKTHEPLGVTILPTALRVENHLTGMCQQYLFSEITAYRFFPAFRGAATLRLALSSGKTVRLNASGISLLTSSNVAQFEMMVQAFKATWSQHNNL